jgi:hypothetical protein
MWPIGSVNRKSDLFGTITLSRDGVTMDAVWIRNLILNT